MLRFQFDTGKKIQAAAVVLRCEGDRMSYLRLLKLELGLLINFNVMVLHDGVKRVINSRCK